MRTVIYNHRFLILRRLTQLLLLVLFVGANYFGWKILNGNYSSALFLEKFHLSDPFASIQILISGYILGSKVIIGAITIFLVYLILGGRIFCSWICPMNIVTDISRWLNRKLKINHLINSKTNRNLRYWILILSILLSALFGIAAFEYISPISILHRGIIFGFGFEIAIVLAIFISDLVVLKDGWCGHLCPLGGFYSIIGKLGFIKIKHTKSNCTNCMKCFEHCPEVQVLDIVGKKDGFIKTGECLNCARCIEKCNDNALHFKLTLKK